MSELKAVSLPETAFDAEIIAVGTEMLTPKRVDTNSLYLTEHLNSLGIEVTTKYVVGDDRARLADTIRTALGRSQIVILSGGLGPTEDDVTRDAVADALRLPLIFHPEIAEQLEQRFQRMNRQMPEINKRQALVIEGAELLSNDRGTAPGQWIEHGGKWVVLLPGPPHELKSMFTRECLPRLQARVPPQAIRTLVLRITGMSESDLDQTISPVYKLYENPVTTVLAHAGDLQVHLRARCSTDAEAEALLAEVGSQVEARLGDRIYSRNGDSLELTVANLMIAAGATVSVAESMTGGGLAERLSSEPGSSRWFAGGMVTYTRQMKIAALGLSGELLEQHGTVSRQTAEAMANAIRKSANTTYGVSITGNAGPTTDGEEAPAGMVYIGIADPRGSAVFERQFLGDRPRVRAFAAQMALDILRRRATPTAA